ncbi:MAG: hypothetical protein ACXW61_08260 [Gemmatirosa sp.]
MTVLRRLRGILGIALTWCAAFALIGALFGLGLVLAIASGALPPSPYREENLYLMIILSRAARWAMIGVLSGIAFAVTLMVAERRQTLATLSPTRVARWGRLAGTLGSGAMAAVVVAFVLLDGTPAMSAWRLLVGFAAVPLFGGLLGRMTATATLRAARGDVAVLPSSRDHDDQRALGTPRATQPVTPR